LLGSDADETVALLTMVIERAEPITSVMLCVTASSAALPRPSRGLRYLSSPKSLRCRRSRPASRWILCTRLPAMSVWSSRQRRRYCTRSCMCFSFCLICHAVVDVHGVSVYSVRLVLAALITAPVWPSGHVAVSKRCRGTDRATS
jgi:hypothetical protein